MVLIFITPFFLETRKIVTKMVNFIKLTILTKINTTVRTITNKNTISNVYLTTLIYYSEYPFVKIIKQICFDFNCQDMKKNQRKDHSQKSVYKYLEIIQKSGYFNSNMGDHCNTFLEIMVINVQNIQQWFNSYLKTRILFLRIVILSNRDCSSSCPFPTPYEVPCSRIVIKHRPKSGI